MARLCLFQAVWFSIFGSKRYQQASAWEHRCGAGATLLKLMPLLSQSTQELRIFPLLTARLRLGVCCGWVRGVGSIRWGGLRDLGNVSRARIVTVEATPRILTLEGDEVLKIAHAYGTNGIITQVEIPLAPAYVWIEMIVAFDNFDQACTFANDLGNQDGILLKELAAMAAPIAQSYFIHHAKYVRHDQDTVFLMVASQNLAALESFIARRQGEISFRSDVLSLDQLHSLPPLLNLLGIIRPYLRIMQILI